MREIDEAEVEAHFEDIVEEVANGELIIITRNGKAVARLTPVNQDKPADAPERVKALRDRLAHEHPEAFNVDEELGRMRGRG